jgi:hypothetical protein
MCCFFLQNYQLAFHHKIIIIKLSFIYNKEVNFKRMKGGDKKEDEIVFVLFKRL